MSPSTPILWLASWYPNKLGPFDGDFIQRHAEAVSGSFPVQVLFVKKGSSSMKDKILIETNVHGELRETIGYYRPLQTGSGLLDRLLSFLQYLFLFRKLILDFVGEHGIPCIVHVHVCMRAGLLAFWMKKKYRVPYLITEHWTGYSSRADENFYQQSLLYRWSAKMVLQKASCILPVCHYLETQMKPLAPEVPFEVINNVVDTDNFFPTNEESGVIRFFHASSLQRQKNPEAILRAFATVKNAGHPWHFAIAGAPTAALRQLGVDLGISERIAWLGEISYKAVAYEMRRSNVLVMYSRFENLPCVIAEAHCCGLTVISKRVGGIPEMIDQYNGIMVDTEKELSEVLQTILEKGGKSWDSGNIAGTAMARYNYQRIAADFERVYERFMP